MNANQCPHNEVKRCGREDYINKKVKSKVLGGFSAVFPQLCDQLIPQRDCKEHSVCLCGLLGTERLMSNTETNKLQFHQEVQTCRFYFMKSPLSEYVLAKGHLRTETFPPANYNLSTMFKGTGCLS